MYYIYRITNLVNGNTYIGQHQPKENEPFDKYLGSGELIRRAIKKHGKENFKKEILYNNIQYKKTADSVEKFAIAKEKAIGKAEYNISTGGTGGDLGPEVRKKMSKAQKGKHLSEETRKKISKALKGRTLNDAWKKKLSESHKGKKLGPASEETKKKRSDALKGKGHSSEWRRKVSEAKKGRPNWGKGKHWHLDENGKRVWSERK